MWYGNLEDLFFLYKAIYLQWNRQKLDFFFGGGGGGLLYFAFWFLFKLNLLEIFNV